MKSLFVSSLSLGFCALAHAVSIAVGPNVHVSAARADLEHGEVVLATDPRDARRLLACSMVLPRPGIYNTAAYVSLDAGKTWSAPVMATEDFANDPTCAIGPDGTMYFYAKTARRYPRKNSDWDALNLRVSSDDGKTWELRKGPFSNDRPFMAFDTTGGKYHNRLYVAYDHHVHGQEGGHGPEDFIHIVRMATSADGGKSYVNIADRGLLDQRNGQSTSPGVGGIAVLSDGTVAVLEQHHIKTAGNNEGGKARTGRSWVQVFLSYDGGESLEPGIKIADIASSTYNLPHCLVASGPIAVDATNGIFRDRLYAVWTDAATGRSEIYLSWSADKGRTWSKPRILNDDQPFGAPGAGPDDYMPNVAVNKDGVVGVMWYDRRENPDNRGYHVRFTASTDGGETFMPSTRVSESPNTPGNAKGASFGVTGGHTAGLAAAADGKFHALWADNRTGKQQVWTAPISVTP